MKPIAVLRTIHCTYGRLGSPAGIRHPFCGSTSLSMRPWITWRKRVRRHIGRGHITCNTACSHALCLTCPCQCRFSGNLQFLVAPSRLSSTCTLASCTQLRNTECACCAGAYFWHTLRRSSGLALQRTPRLCLCGLAAMPLQKWPLRPALYPALRRFGQVRLCDQFARETHHRP